MYCMTPPLLSRRSALLLGAATVLFSTTALAAEPPINTLKHSVFGGRTDTAINGYDPVAYFTVGKPAKGLDNLATDWMAASGSSHRRPIWTCSNQTPRSSHPSTVATALTVSPRAIWSRSSPISSPCVRASST